MNVSIAGVVREFFIRDRLGELSFDIALFMQHLQPEFLAPGTMRRLWNTRLLPGRARANQREKTREPYASARALIAFTSAASGSAL